MTFSEVADLYLAQPTDKFPSKQTNARYIVGLLKEAFGDLPVTALEKKQPILNYLTKLRSQPSLRRKGKLVSNGYVNSHITYLIAVLRFARDELEILNRVPQVKKHRTASRETFLTPQQVRKFIGHLDELRADMVAFSCCIGFRNTNVRLLKWADLSGDFKFVRLSDADTKNGERVQLPLIPEAQEIIQRRLHRAQYLEARYPYLKGQIQHVFVQESPRKQSNGKPFASSSVICNGTWHRARSLAGLPESTVFHTMRHTFASWHLAGGTSESELQELGNWKSVQSMKIYTHLAMAQKERAASNISGMLRR